MPAAPAPDLFEYVQNSGRPNARTESPLPAAYFVKTVGYQPNVYEIEQGVKPEISFREIIRSTPDSVRTESDGFKLHLSVAQEDLPRAFNAIAPILFEAEVKNFKFADGQNLIDFSDPNSSQAGKIVTIRDPGNGSFADIAQKLEVALAKEGVRPGPEIAGDRMIPGSDYIGYRNEKSFELAEYNKTRNPEYISAEKVRDLVDKGIVEAGFEYNPTKRPDSLLNVDFSTDKDVLAARSMGAARIAEREAEPKPQAVAQEPAMPREPAMNREPEMAAPGPRVTGKLVLDSVPTNKGSAHVVRGGENDLLALQEIYSKRGINSVVETAESAFGAGLRIKSDSNDKFDKLADTTRYNGELLLAPPIEREVAPKPQAFAREPTVNREPEMSTPSPRVTGRIELEYVDTNKGSARILRGSENDLQVLQDTYRQKGIASVIEGSDSTFGAGLRIRSESNAAFDKVADITAYNGKLLVAAEQPRQQPQQYQQQQRQHMPSDEQRALQQQQMEAQRARQDQQREAASPATPAAAATPAMGSKFSENTGCSGNTCHRCSYANGRFAAIA